MYAYTQTAGTVHSMWRPRWKKAGRELIVEKPRGAPRLSE
jgi:hypothetical protein